ncbi:MAG: TAXI family TRAP transporter solute-binding subunit [Planctomycetota bacterium]
MASDTKREWSERLKIWGPSLVVAGVLMVLAWYFAEPAPPDRIAFAAGSPGGAYIQNAQRYANTFADAGIELAVQQTAGSMENLDLLRDPNSGVDAALIQGGVIPRDKRDGLRGVLAVFYEPIWLFVRAESKITGPANLPGQRLAVGTPGSGTRVAADQFLKDYRLTEQVNALELTSAQAAEALRTGNTDAALFVMGPNAPLIRELLTDPRVTALSFDRAPGFARRADHLAHVTLFAGSVDPADNLPPTDLQLPAAAAALVVREDVHPAVVQLLVWAAQDAHRRGTLLNEPAVFPNATALDLPLHDDVDYHLRTGKSFLQRKLPFWAASLVDRLLIFILPLLVLLLPLLRTAPSLYRWRIRSRIYKWYKLVRHIDERVRLGEPHDALEADLNQLNELESELLDVQVPLSYMEEFYHLRLHLGYVRQRLRDRLDDESTDDSTT